MSDSQLRQLVAVRQGAYLPHWTLDGAIYHVVFRLGDSLPAGIVETYRLERDAVLRASSTRDPNTSPELTTRLNELFSERIESALDKGLGACWLRREDVATLTADALQHFNHSRYILHAWCVMPNHVHVVVQPQTGHALASILKSWKGYCAREANLKIGRAGEFWQPEYYDHIIRDAAELSRVVRYVQDNPGRAGLKSWRWLYPSAV